MSTDLAQATAPTGNAATEAPRQRVDRAGVALFCVMIFFFWSSMYIYVPILPVYAQALGATNTMIGLLVGAYGFSQMLLRIPVGVFSDRLGRRRPFVAIGFVAAGAGALGFALVPTPELLVVSRAVVGISASMWVVSTVLFAGYFPHEDSARAIGLLAFIGGLSQLVSMNAGGLLAEAYGWHAPFYAGAVLGAIGLVASIPIRESRVQREPPTFRRLVAIGTIPSLLLIGTVSALSQYASWATTFTFLPLYANSLGATKTELGLLTSLPAIPAILTALLVAPLAHRFGSRWVVVGGLLLMVATTIVVPFIHALVPLAVSQLIGGAGRGLCQTALMSESIRGVATHERATAMGVFQAVYAIGMFVGPATAGGVADSLGIAGAFWASAIITLVGAMLAVYAIRHPTA